MVSVSPCKECENRFVGCHQYCEEYNDWKRISEKVKRQQNKQRATEYMLNEVRRKSIKKAK